MFKYIISFLSLVVTTVILQTDTHASSCTGCTNGQYCNTINGPTAECASCNKPNDATFTSVGSDNNINSCRWKIQCSNKPDFQNGTWAPDDDYSTGYGSTVSANNGLCTYTYTQNITCDAGYYRNNNTCVACAAGTYKSTVDNSTSCTNADDGYYVDTTGATSQTRCPYGYRDGSDGQRTNVTNCYAIKNCVLTQQGASCPDNATCQYDACSNSSCTIYKQYVNASGNDDGTYSGTKEASCIKPVNDFTCNTNYYKDGDECTQCPYGSTSRIGAEAKTECYFKPGTQIRDSRNNNTYYTVPSGTPLYLVQ